MNRIERSAREFDRWQQHHRPIAFVVAVAKKFGDDQAGNLVALLAYYAFLATFPLLLALTTILGLVLRDFPRLQRDLLNSAFAGPLQPVLDRINVQLDAAVSGYCAGSRWRTVTAIRGITSKAAVRRPNVGSHTEAALLLSPPTLRLRGSQKHH